MVRIATGVAGLGLGNACLTVLGLASPLHELREPIVSDAALYVLQYSTVFAIDTLHFVSVYSVFCISN